MTNIQKKLPIPDLKSREEVAEWFDTHDMTDYAMEPGNVTFELESTQEENMVIRMQTSVKKRLEQTARSKGLGASTLARMWIIERLQAAA